MKQIEIRCQECGKTINIRWYDEDEIELLSFNELINWTQSDKGIVYLQCTDCM